MANVVLGLSYTVAGVIGESNPAAARSRNPSRVTGTVTSYCCGISVPISDCEKARLTLARSAKPFVENVHGPVFEFEIPTIAIPGDRGFIETCSARYVFVNSVCPTRAERNSVVSIDCPI